MLSFADGWQVCKTGNMQDFEWKRKNTLSSHFVFKHISFLFFCYRHEMHFLCTVLT